MSNRRENNGCSFSFGLSWILGIPTAIIGHEIHGSIFWAIVDFFFYPIAWIKWLICKEVNLSIIKDAFEFFLQ